MALKQVIMFSGEDIPEVYDGQGVRGLWISDGTTAGTYRLKGINGANPAASISPSAAGPIGGLKDMANCGEARTRPMLGFKSFPSAAATLSGIELMRMSRKERSWARGKLRPAQQFYALAA